MTDRAPHWLRRSAIPFSTRAIVDAALLSWFAAWSALDSIPRLGNLGGDARLYYEGALAWLAGGDPWSVSVGEFHFAGLPPTVVAFAPFTLLPVDTAVILWLVLSAGAAVFVVRHLRLPWYWLLFPPLLQGVTVANPHVLILALLLAGHPAMEGLAAALKGYALVPVAIRLRWRGVVATGTLGLVLVAIFPGLWLVYVRDFPTISAQLAHDAAGGFSATWLGEVLVIPALAALSALWFVDRDAAGWLAVPALWPASQYLYASFVMPIRSPALAAALTIPTRGWTPLVITAYALTVAIQASIRRAKERPAPSIPAG